MSFDLSTAAEVNEDSQGLKTTGSFDVHSAKDGMIESGDHTAYEAFSKERNPFDQPKPETQPKGTPSSNKGQQKTPFDSMEETTHTLQTLNPPLPEGKKQLQPGEVRKMAEFPDHGFLNGPIMAGDVLTTTFGGPQLPTEEKQFAADRLAEMSAKHPIQAILAGTVPFIATAPLFPEGLIGLSANFATVSGLSEMQRQQVSDSLMKPTSSKIIDVAKETSKGALMGPIWHYSEGLNFIGRPFASAIVKSGARGAGTATLDKVYGSDLTQAFKDGGIITALSLVFESPSLARSVIGKGVINHSNSILKDKESSINPDAPVEMVQTQVLKAVKELSAQVKGANEPKLVASAIKLNDGATIEGSSHVNALEKIGKNESNLKESSLPKVSLKDQEGSAKKSILDESGKDVGYVAYGKNMSDEGFHIEVNADMRKAKIAPAAIDQVFKYGEQSIVGDVGKNNTLAQKFWESVGGKLVEQKSGNFKMYLSKADFYKNTYESGYTVMDPNGKTEFISKEAAQSKFNNQLDSEGNIKGLPQQEFIGKPEQPEIVNPNSFAKIGTETGSLDVNMIPGVAEAAEILQNSHAELKEKFTPYTVGEEGKFTAATLRENLGRMARSYDRVNDALLKARTVFDKASKESSLDFIQNMEEGKPQSDKSLDKVANVLRDMLDSKRDEVRALGTGKLENWIENYFPHVWEQPNKVGQVIGKIMGKRPFQGPASFLKKRTIPTTKEGIELGFTPVTYNPIDSVMLKVREMDRYIMAHNTIKALKEQGIVKFVRTGESSPAGWVKIDDRMSDVVYKNDKQETVLAGKYFIQPDAGRILNNYLSPGLKGKSYLYDLYRDAGNTLNQFQLGLSAFHLGFTSMDATISKFALGLNKLSGGDFAGAVKEFAKTPFAPVTNILEGRKLLQAWLGKDQGPTMNAIADAMASAGGRAKMDKFYATEASASMQKALKEGKILTASMKVPFYLVEQAARPIMEYIVPRQKLGVFADIVKMEMERNPAMTHEQLRDVSQKAWDSVDNRMGQLVYDNLFWNKVVKDLSMASVRSLGWNLGTIREVGGGVKDVVGNVQDMIHGKGTKMSYRTAYVMALPIVTGLYGAIYQYFHTGKGPEELKDYFFPKNGGIDKRGQEARISLPTYMKDLYHYSTNPVQTVINKFSPVNNTVLEMLYNKDFYGVEIRNTDDPVIQQVLSEFKFVGSQFIPFGIRNIGRDTREDTMSKVEPFIGFVSAPYDVNMTKAEREANELAKAKIPVGSRTKEQAEHSQKKSEIRSKYIADKDESILNDAVEQEIISPKEKKAIIKQAGMTSLGRATQHLSFEEVKKVYGKADDKEKVELEAIMAKKKANKKKAGTWTKSEEAMYVKIFDSQE